MENNNLPEYVDEYATKDGENRRLVNNGHGWFNAVNHDAIKRASCGCDQWCALFEDQTGITGVKHAQTVKKKTSAKWDKSETVFIEGKKHRVAKKKKVTKNICDFCGDVIDKWTANTGETVAVPTDEKCDCQKNGIMMAVDIIKNDNTQCPICKKVYKVEDGEQDEK